MIAKCFSAAVLGIDAFPVEVEVNVTNSGMQDVISIVGLPDAAVRESRDRIKSALLSCSIALPGGTTIVNLAPADLRKEGASFDLAIALGILAANGRIPEDRLRRLAVIGELALDGTIRPIKGALPIAVSFSANNLVDAIILPRTNGEEAALASENCPVFAVSHLLEVIDYLNGREELTPYKADLQEYLRDDNVRKLDFSDVKGQIMARRAMEIAAAGGHNSLLIGPPGTGKSMISSRLPGILPPMTLAETLETSRIYSVLGMLADGKPLLNKRPFRAPHHTISDVGLIGGGKEPKPGEISLA
ncbi:MAG: ATP-binding protein, partial [Victivallaceae bacterium]